MTGCDWPKANQVEWKSELCVGSVIYQVNILSYYLRVYRLVSQWCGLPVDPGSLHEPPPSHVHDLWGC